MSGYEDFMNNLNLDDLKPDPTLMSNLSMLDGNREVFGETMKYIFDITNQLRDEITAIGMKRMEFLNVCVELEGTRYYILLKRSYSRLQIVANKEQVLYYEVNQIWNECRANWSRLECPRFVEWAKKKENTMEAMQESIMSNRLAANLKVSAERVKQKWDAVKEHLFFEITDCLRLAEELRTRYKESKK